jgi:3-methylcrotonyl-CoA carboxylase alpha subunit
MIKTLLIANRGEIACRIIRTARRMGITTVACYSDADRNALHVHMADRAVYLGASPATESYLAIDKVLAAARATGADAIHPGYGFLSENAEFAAAVKAAELIFVGPTAEAMRALGGKAAAKEIAIKAGVPVVPGYQGASQDAATLTREADRIGYPVMIKAVAGGGGRGMRLVASAKTLPELLDSAQREAAAAFADPRVLIEKVVVAPRHVEVQVFGDMRGNVVHLFERDCTLQRRNQKVIEEAPAPGMSETLRAKMCEAAVKLAKSVGYTGAGTVEFLVEGGGLEASARWYFIEMNTRLQVEHPVTEAITELDLVEWQLRIASGEPLPLTQDRITMCGHAIEVRLCAEDPAHDFRPATGRIAAFPNPADLPDTRLETGVRAGDEISPFYDSMIAKLITAGADRTEALARLTTALDRAHVAGVRTNGAFLRALATHPDVVAHRFDTGLIGRELTSLTTHRPSSRAIEAAIERLLARERIETSACDPWSAADAFSTSGVAERRLARAFTLDGEPLTATTTWRTGDLHITLPDHLSRDETGDARPVLVDHARGVYVLDRLVQHDVGWPIYDPSAIEDGAAGTTLRAPINGRVAKLFAAVGDSIEKGQKIAVVEAMKMEHVLAAKAAGRLASIAVSEGAQVIEGALIATIEASADAPA